MKLSRVHVDRYGPLRDTYDFDDGVTVLHGPNESGKTLFVESLLRLLTGSKQAANARVDEAPEGFVVLEDGAGESKLGHGNTLLDRLDTRYGLDVNPVEFRNVFVVQNAKPAIDQEERFYRRMTGQIVGLWTRDIETVRDAVLDRGRLTPTERKLSGSQRHENAKNQVDAATGLQADIDDYFEFADQNGVVDLERDLYRAKREARQAEAELKELKAARRAAEHAELERDRNRLSQALSARSELPDNETVEELGFELNRVANRVGERGELDDQKQLYRHALTGSLVAGVITFIAGVATESSAAILAPVAFVAFGLYAAVRYRGASKQLADIDDDCEQLLASGRRAGIETDSREQLRSRVNTIQEQYKELDTTVTEKAAVLRDRLGIDAEDPSDVVEAAASTLDDWEVDDAVEPDDDITRSDIETAKERLDNAEDECKLNERALRDHEQQLTNFGHRARELKFETFTGDTLDVEPTDLQSLHRLREELEEFVAAVRRDADTSRAAAAVLDEMAAAENEKMAELFEDGGEAEQWFRTVTDGRYQRIEYEHRDDPQLVVERESGERLPASALSQGTRNQLYLAVRVALGRRLLDGRRGFFVMDDAFLASDGDRLREQARVVDELQRDGWQVVYLTAKEATCETLQAVADADVTELRRLR